jgi:2-dehydro-3-deoxygluconokinase
MRVLAIGEGMVEFRRCGEGWSQSHGGDVLNTAIHLRRFGHAVAFASAIGPDPFSQQLRCAWDREGLDLSLLAIDPARQCGIYFIETDAAGERSFIYWRDQSAAKQMVRLLAGKLSVRAAASDLVYLSLITVAILSAEDRKVLLEILTQAKRSGAKVAFDNNYRQMLWRDEEAARHWRAQFCSIADFGLPTLDDEEMLGEAASASAVQACWAGLGCPEVVVKTGKNGCVLPDHQALQPEELVQVVDTSGAGDSFNAAYLSCRLAGQTPLRAAQAGNRLASWVIGQKGAVPPEKSELYRSTLHNTG